MRRWQRVGLLLCGLAGATAASGCKDDPAGAEVSDDTAWRVGCTRRGGACATNYDRHGGPDLAGEIKATCKKEGSRLTIELEDPGKESGEQRGRNRSIVEITSINVEKNECIVGVFEYDRAANKNQLRFVDTCAGNSDRAGTCEITGDMDSNGYDFNGTVFCNGMKLNNTSAPDFSLEKPDDEGGEPVTLQIVNCS